VLLAAGANINAKGSDGRTVLLLSLGNFAYDNRRMIELLVAHGADVHARELRRELGQTLLHAVAADGDVEALELLLSHGADIGARDHGGFTPLHRAAQKGRVDIAARLFAAGADAHAAATDGTTALDLASGDREMEALIRHHANK
jgi:ankyrin repeat protein